MAKKKDQEQVSCKVHETYGYLNDKQNKVFARVSWGDNGPKYDIRKCYEKDGELKLGSGISLSEEELQTLMDVAESVKEKMREVDFDEIFASAPSIQENREKGFRTEDGFIRLRKKEKR